MASSPLVVPRVAAAGLLGKLLNMHILRTQSDPLYEKLWGWQNNLCFNKTSRSF